eukprot:TRINITY_DN44969_c0_g1_i1.p1 TRINITY_DN44969_c0_g1~~TRINITY_DN44969_c0_g1_i1.p1  ORF type:complete len:369 (+),score=95.93 TRINITY_DN44969_c0_g1_i1:253-1359(+)
MARGHLGLLALVLWATRFVCGVIVDSRDDAEEEQGAQPEKPHLQQFLVDKSELGSTPSIGVTYRRSKDLSDEALTYEVFGTTVTGVDAGDGWVHVNRLGYLPKQLGGKTVLRLQGDAVVEPSTAETAATAAAAAAAVPAQERTYLVDNSMLHSAREGLMYRRSKALDDKDGEEHFARYGSRVVGLDEGDGWLRVGERYLPFQVKGVPVLQAVAPQAGAGVESASTADADPRHKLTSAAIAEKQEKTLVAGLSRWGRFLWSAPVAVMVFLGMYYLMDWQRGRQPYRRFKQPPSAEKGSEEPSEDVARHTRRQAPKADEAAATPSEPQRAQPAARQREKEKDDEESSAPRKGSVKSLLSAFEGKRQSVRS